ncbi:MAG TPA: hypothetical protein PLR52_07120 [Bacteroidales bacterium]|nr:hypothetical protein [Bacteroidales bacterium]HPI68184.1 hypothetical protein [Bacteroidales bacterium]
MVLKKTVILLKKIIFFFLLTICFSCEKYSYYFVDCNDRDCTATKPTIATLEIKCDKAGGGVLIKIYEGILEDDIIYNSFTTSSSNITTDVPVNRTYTLTASYTYYGDMYVIVNSVTPRVRYVENMCENPCYYVYDKVVDLRLKQ